MDIYKNRYWGIKDICQRTSLGSEDDMCGVLHEVEFLMVESGIVEQGKYTKLTEMMEHFIKC